MTDNHVRGVVDEEQVSATASDRCIGAVISLDSSRHEEEDCKRATKKRLPKLTRLAHQVLLYLINNLANEDYDRCSKISQCQQRRQGN